MTADKAGMARAGEIGILPAATTWRFILLMVTLAAGALSLDYVFLAVLTQAFPRNSLSDGSCYTTLAAQVRAQDLDFGINFNDCVTGHRLAASLVAASAVPVIIVVAWCLYRVYPRLAPRLAGARPLAEVTAVVPARVLRLIEEQVALAGRPVDVLVTAARPTADGRALGCYPRYRVLLDLGLLASAEHDERRLRAILGHEVAHIRNRDIDITYLAMSLWWACLLVEVPVYLTELIVAPVTALAEVSWRALTLLAIVWLARASVLRTREYYADLTLAAGDAAADSLAVALAANAARERTGRVARTIRAVSYHPGARGRLAMLADSGPLFRLWPIDCFVAGALIGLSYTPVQALLASFGLPIATADPALGALFGLLAGAVLAAGIWRQVYLRLRAGQLPGNYWAQAASFATGIVIGQFTTPPGQAASGLYHLLLSRPVHALVIVAALYVLCYLLFPWMSVSAACWLPAARSLRLASVAGTLIAVVVCGSWISYWFRALELLQESSTPWQLLLLLGQASAVNGYTALSLALAVAYPAAAWAYIRLRGDTGRMPAARLASVPAGIAIAGVLFLAVTFLPLAFLDSIRHAALVSNQATNGTALGYFTAPLEIHAAAAAAAGLGAGIALGRRATVPQVVVSVGLCALIVAPYAVWCALFDLAYALLAGHRGVLGVLGELPFGTWLDLGPLMTIWFASLAGAGMLGAVAGSGIRRLARPARATMTPGMASTPPPAPPARRRLVSGTVTMLVTLVAAVILIGYPLRGIYGLAVAPLASGVGSTSYVTAVKQQRVLPFRSMTRLASCLQVREDVEGVQQASLTRYNEMAVIDAQAAASAYEGDDPSLAALGLSLGNAMFTDQGARVGPLVNAIIWYCDAVLSTDKPIAASGS